MILLSNGAQIGIKAVEKSSTTLIASLTVSCIAVVIIHVVDEICPFLRHVIVSVVHWFLC
jgi:hypothetical protein